MTCALPVPARSPVEPSGRYRSASPGVVATDRKNRTIGVFFFYKFQCVAAERTERRDRA